MKFQVYSFLLFFPFPFSELINKVVPDIWTLYIQYSAGYPFSLSIYPLAGYPAKSVSGTTLLIKEKEEGDIVSHSRHLFTALLRLMFFPLNLITPPPPRRIGNVITPPLGRVIRTFFWGLNAHITCFGI